MRHIFINSEGNEMNKQIVNEDQFLEACNQELKKHPNYEEGMEIVGVPQDASGSDLTGYNWKGPASMPGIVVSVIKKVKEQYELYVTPRQEI
jgi:hypothetical protein